MPITCDNEVSVGQQELINGLLVKLPTGEVGIRVRRMSAAAADITEFHECPEFVFLIDETQIFRHAIGASVSGKAALILVEET